jgi:hypothetical protein
MTLYHCPDCDRIHDEPFEATFTLLARCIDCALASERAAALAEPIAVPRAA